MKHQTVTTGWPSGNIGLLDFRARLPEVWGSNPGGEKDICVYLPSLSYKCFVAVY